MHVNLPWPLIAPGWEVCFGGSAGPLPFLDCGYPHPHQIPFWSPEVPEVILCTPLRAKASLPDRMTPPDFCRPQRPSQVNTPPLLALLFSFVPTGHMPVMTSRAGAPGPRLPHRDPNSFFLCFLHGTRPQGSYQDRPRVWDLKSHFRGSCYSGRNSQGEVAPSVMRCCGGVSRTDLDS